MPLTRIVGLVLVVAGVVLLVIGHNASQSAVDQLSRTFLGRYTNETVWYIVGGAAAIVAGALLALLSCRPNGATRADRRVDGDRTRSVWHPAAALPLLLIVGPYYLNKLVYIAHPGDYTAFIVTDYADRLFTLALLWLVVRRAAVGFPIPWRLGADGAKDVGWVVAGLALLIVADVLGHDAKEWLNALTGRLTRYPEPPTALLTVIDDTVGMVATGLSEEAIFRFYLINVLLLRGLSMRGAIVLSTIVFAAIHWSYGGGNVAYAGFAGLVFATIYVATRSLLAPVLIHTLVDVYFFTDTDVLLRRLLFE